MWATRCNGPGRAADIASIVVAATALAMAASVLRTTATAPRDPSQIKAIHTATRSPRPGHTRTFAGHTATLGWSARSRYRSERPQHISLPTDLEAAAANL